MSPPHQLEEATPMTRNSAFLWSALAVTLMVACAFGIFLIISAYGGRLTAPAAPASSTSVAAAAAPQDILLHVLIALAAVIAVGLLLSKIFTYLGQPPVIGEVLAGILLGPSLIGPQASAWILPQAAAPTLGVIAQLGIVLYMFII